MQGNYIIYVLLYYTQVVLHISHVYEDQTWVDMICFPHSTTFIFHLYVCHQTTYMYVNISIHSQSLLFPLPIYSSCRTSLEKIFTLTLFESNILNPGTERKISQIDSEIPNRNIRKYMMGLQISSSSPKKSDINIDVVTSTTKSKSIHF